MKTLLNLVIATIMLAVFGLTFGCSTTNYKTVNYHVYECEIAEETLGDFIFAQTREHRFLEERDTCSKMPVYFLRDNKLKNSSYSDINPHRVARAFAYRYFTNRDKIFWGPDETMSAVMNEQTFNIILDSEANYFIYKYKPINGEGDMEQKIVSSHDDVKNKVLKNTEIVHCENLFVFLSRISKSPSWSVVITNAKNSNAEYRFLNISEGIGGFYTRH